MNTLCIQNLKRLRGPLFLKLGLSLLALSIFGCDDASKPVDDPFVINRGGSDDIGTGGASVNGGTSSGGQNQGGEMQGGTNTDSSLACGVAEFEMMGPYAVGFREEVVEGSPVAVWYPAQAGSDAGQTPYSYDMREWLPQEVSMNIPDDGAPRFETLAYENLPAATDGPFPIVMFAHGLAGYRMQSSTLMAHLASWGFVVTSAENDGIHLPVILGGGVPSMDRGTTLMQATYDQLPSWNADGPLASLLDLNRVGVMGHSMGTATAINLANEDFVSAWVALAGAGFGAGPSKPFMIIGGTTDALATPPQVENGFSAQPGFKRKILIEGAGHLAFSDICMIAREEGGLIAVASTYGLDVPDIIISLAQDGCRPTDLPAEEAWPLIHHFVVAHFQEFLYQDDNTGFNADVLSCYESRLNELLEIDPGSPNNPMTGGSSMTGGSMAGGSNMSGGSTMMGGSNMAGGSNTTGGSEVMQEPGVPNQVICGGTPCDLATNICCVGLSGQSCESGDSCGFGSAPQSCDGPEDCSNGQQCCVSFPAGSSCQDACEGFGSETLCHLDSECGSGQLCLLCDYPAGAQVQICGEPGTLPPGAVECEMRSLPTEPIDEPEMNDPEMGGSEMGGSEMGGSEMGGSEMGGSEMGGSTPPSETLGNPEPDQIACGNLSCDLTQNTCCVGFLGTECVAGVNQTCGFGSVQQVCDGPEECESGQSCCLNFGFPASYACGDQCTNVTLCHADADCGAGEICRNCQYPNVEVAACTTPNGVPSGALSCTP